MPQTHSTQTHHHQSTRSHSSFRRFTVPADGSCFYHAVSWWLRHLPHKASQHTSDDIRRAVVVKLREQLQLLLSRSRTSVGAASLHAAIQRAHRRSGRSAWAEHEEVHAAALAYSICICVYEGTNNQWTTFGEGRRRIYLLNQHNAHFEPIVPTNDLITLRVCN